MFSLNSQSISRMMLLLTVCSLFVLLPVVSHADYSFNGISYYNPYNPYNPLPNGSPNLPPNYTGAYNPYIDHGPSVTIINPGYAYPMVVNSPGVIIQNGYRRGIPTNVSSSSPRVQVHYDRPIMDMPSRVMQMPSNVMQMPSRYNN